MVKIALDPTPFHHSHSLLEFPAVAAELGYEYLQMTPHADFIPFFNHARADDDLVQKMKKACKAAGVQIASTLPVLRISSPDPDARDAAVRNFKRVIEITSELDVDVIGTEFSGRPEKAEESERAFYRSMEELVPIIEKAGIKLFIDPHPDDFVENGMAAWRVIRGVNSKNLGMVYVASHTFHMGNQPLEILEAAKGRVGIVHMSDTMDHTRSHGLRYITNPPGNAVRVHQHLKIGDGDVNWDEFFGGLGKLGFYERENTVMVSSVFAENENAHEVSRYQRETMNDYVAKPIDTTVRPSPRDGVVIEELGWYEPQGKDGKQMNLKMDRINHWLSVGAQPTNRVLRFNEKPLSPEPMPGRPDVAVGRPSPVS